MIWETQTLIRCQCNYFSFRVSGPSQQPWASYQIRKIAGCVPGMPGTFSSQPSVSNPDLHHGTCVTHASWCMPGSLTSGFLWSRWRGKRSRHSRRMRNPKFYVSGKRHMVNYIHHKLFIQDISEIIQPVYTKEQYRRACLYDTQVVRQCHKTWYGLLKGLRMVARALWRSEARRVVPWSETLHEP